MAFTFSVRKTAGVVTAGAAMLAVGLAAAPAAAENEEGLPPEVDTLVEETPWPSYTEGSEGYGVMGAQYLLAEYVDYEPEEFDGIYDPEMTAAVEEYQELQDIEVNGDLKDPTWPFLRDDYGIVRYGADGDLVFAAQSTLVGHGYLVEDDIDGQFGDDTLEAVRAFQTDLCEEAEVADECQVDGEVGPITFRGLFNDEI